MGTTERPNGDDARAISAGAVKDELIPPTSLAARLGTRFDVARPTSRTFQGLLHYLATEVGPKELIGDKDAQEDLIGYLALGEVLRANPCPALTITDNSKTVEKVRQQREVFLLSDCRLYFFSPHKTPDHPSELRRVEDGGCRMQRFNRHSKRWETIENETVNPNFVFDTRRKLERSQMSRLRRALDSLARLQDPA